MDALKDLGTGCYLTLCMNCRSHTSADAQTCKKTAYCWRGSGGGVGIALLVIFWLSKSNHSRQKE